MNKKAKRENGNQAARNMNAAKGLVNKLLITGGDNVSARLKRELITIFLRCVDGSTMQGFITHPKIQSMMTDKSSIRQIERAFSSLRQAGHIFTQTIYGTTPNGLWGVIGTKITLTSIRDKLKSALKHVPAIFSAQLPLTQAERGKTKIIERQMLWMSDETGKLIKKTTERIRCTA